MTRRITTRNTRIFTALVKHYTKMPGVEHNSLSLYKKFGGENEKFSAFQSRVLSDLISARRLVIKNRKTAGENEPKNRKTAGEKNPKLYPDIEYYGPPQPKVTLKGTKYLPYIPKQKTVYYRLGVMDAVLQFMIDHPGERLSAVKFAPLAGVNPSNKWDMRILHNALGNIARRLAKERPWLAAKRYPGGPRLGPRRKRGNLGKN